MKLPHYLFLKGTTACLQLLLEKDFIKELQRWLQLFYISAISHLRFFFEAVWFSVAMHIAAGFEFSRWARITLRISGLYCSTAKHLQGICIWTGELRLHMETETVPIQYTTAVAITSLPSYYTLIPSAFWRFLLSDTSWAAARGRILKPLQSQSVTNHPWWSADKKENQ